MLETRSGPGSGRGPGACLRASSCERGRGGGLGSKVEQPVALLSSQERPKPRVPVLHFRAAQPPFVICVKLVSVRLGHVWLGQSQGQEGGMSCPPGGCGLGQEVMTAALGGQESDPHGGGDRRQQGHLQPGLGCRGRWRRWCPMRQVAFPMRAAGDKAAQKHLRRPCIPRPPPSDCRPNGFLHHPLAFSPSSRPRRTGARFSALGPTLGSCSKACVLELPPSLSGSHFLAYKFPPRSLLVGSGDGDVLLILEPSPPPCWPVHLFSLVSGSSALSGAGP